MNGIEFILKITGTNVQLAVIGAQKYETANKKEEKASKRPGKAASPSLCAVQLYNYIAAKETKVHM